MARPAKKAPPKKPTTKTADKKPKQPAKPGRMTVVISPEVAERARNAAYWEPGVTVAGLIEAGLTREVDRLERERGESYPKRRTKLKAGRPIST
jgi:hypothetical protein